MTSGGSPLSRRSTDLRLFVPPHRMCSLMLQLLVLSGSPFECSRATLLDDVHGLLDQKALRRSLCISQTALRHLQVFGLEVGSEFLRIVGIFKFTKTFPKFPLVLWATLSSRRRSTSSRTRLGSAISRDLSRIFMVATRSLWSVPANSALRKTLQF